MMSVGSDFVRVVGKEESSPNLIQVWGLCYEEATMAPPTVSLQYFVELSGRGSVWSLSWSARDVCAGNAEGGSLEEEEVCTSTTASCLAILYRAYNSRCYLLIQARWGVLAAVCGDGSCLILMLPKNNNQDAAADR